MTRTGKGPEILLVHGGASPDATWGALAPLSARWTLASVHRRGYSPSPAPPDGRQDFEVDAAHSASAVSAGVPTRHRPLLRVPAYLIAPPARKPEDVR